MKRSQFNQLAALIALGGSAGMAGLADGGPVTLENGPGDGTVSIVLDGYGSFGDAVGGDIGTGETTYDPIGSQEPRSIAFESSVAARIGNSGPRRFLTSGFVGSTSSPLPTLNVSGGGTRASSSFAFGGLAFDLVQTLAPMTGDGGARAGSVLTQTYTVANRSGSGVNDLELVRYIDGDLAFGDGAFRNDGGGRLVNAGREILFDTDTAAGTAQSTTYFGITAEGGTEPDTDRWEASSFARLRDRVAEGGSLNEMVEGDGDDADQFVDTGNGYDISLALRNIFDIPAGGQATYTTQTIFGTGVPADVLPPTDGGVDGGDGGGVDGGVDGGDGGDGGGVDGGDDDGGVDGGDDGGDGGGVDGGGDGGGVDGGDGGNVIPLPAAAWAGLSLFGIMGGYNSLRRCRRTR